MNKFWPTSDTALNNRRLCKPWLIGILCGLVAPLTTLIYAIRQKSLAVFCIPLLTVFTTEALILPVDRTSSQKYIYQIICGAAAYCIAKRQKIEARTDKKLRSISSYQSFDRDTNPEVFGGVVIGFALLKPIFRENLLTYGAEWMPAAMPSIAVGMSLVYISRWYFWDLITNNILSVDGVNNGNTSFKFPKIKSDLTQKFKDNFLESVKGTKKIINQISEPKEIEKSGIIDWIHQLTEDQKRFLDKNGAKDNETLNTFLKRYYSTNKNSNISNEGADLSKVLKEYKDLYSQGLIDEDEYKKLRKKILGL